MVILLGGKVHRIATLTGVEHPIPLFRHHGGGLAQTPEEQPGARPHGTIRGPTSDWGVIGAGTAAADLQHRPPLLTRGCCRARGQSQLRCSPHRCR
jgi:hypothetical protein